MMASSLVAELKWPVIREPIAHAPSSESGHLEQTVPLTLPPSQAAVRMAAAVALLTTVSAADAMNQCSSAAHANEAAITRRKGRLDFFIRFEISNVRIWTGDRTCLAKASPRTAKQQPHG